MKDYSRRYYNEANRGEDTSRHVLSNGNILYVFEGFDIVGARSIDGANLLFGFLCSEELDGIFFETFSRKVPGKDAWEYTILKNGKVCGTCYDYITTKGSLVREFDMATSLKFKIRLDKNTSAYFPGIYCVKKGTHYINDYPTSEDVYLRLDSDNCNINYYDSDIVFFVEHKGKIIISVNKNVEDLNDSNLEEFNFDIFNPIREQIKDVEEMAYYLFKSFLSKNGGLISALPWNLSYIRDCSGALNGMLSLHMYEDVKKVLLFFNKKFTMCNQIATAVSVGNDNTLHIHENDYSENTGYIILMAFKYYETTKDEDFLREILPLLIFAYKNAKELLVDGMMPFSGDETYVAGNMIPRVVVDEGSAESTLLFIESTKKILPYLPENLKKEAKELLETAVSKFRDNFVKDGKIMANNPSRRLKAKLKETRKGVCPYCYSYGFCHLNKYNLYACDNCIDKDLDISNNKQFYLTCVSMMPLYIDSDIFTKEELIDTYELFAKKLIGIYNENKESNEKIAGYEYGLLLHGLVKLNSPYMHEIFKICLQARDSEKTWSEYYIGKKHCGMRWKSWECGVNIMAVEEYLGYIKNENIG